MKRFDNELDALQRRMAEMATLAQSMVGLASDAVQERHKDVHQEVAEAESRLDQMQTEIDHEAVRLMTSPQTGDLKTGFTPGNCWGLGWCIIREPQDVTGMLSAGNFNDQASF